MAGTSRKYMTHIQYYMSLSPVFWGAQQIYWRSIVCCSGTEEKGEQRHDDISFVSVGIIHLSFWDKDSWKSHVLQSSFLQQQPCKNRLPVYIYIYFLFLLHSQLNDLFDAPKVPAYHVSCFCSFLMKGFTITPTQSSVVHTVHKCRISFFVFSHVGLFKYI